MQYERVKTTNFFNQCRLGRKWPEDANRFWYYGKTKKSRYGEVKLSSFLSVNTFGFPQTGWRSIRCYRPLDMPPWA
jgi:hypothetical protein